MLSEGEALGHEVVVDQGKGAGGEEIDGHIEISRVSRAMHKCGGGEAMAWDVGESGGEDGVFGGCEGSRYFVLVRVVITGTCWYSGGDGGSKGAKNPRCCH